MFLFPRAVNPNLFPYPPLFRSPEQRDLLGECVLQPPPLGERRAFVVEPGQERGDASMSLEHRAARCLGRVRREDELDPKPLSDRKSTRLNSSHLGISYAVFCVK